MTASKKSPTVDLLAQLSEQLRIEISPQESPEEILSRLRREEAESSHKNRVSLYLHLFGMAMVATGLGIRIFIVLSHDPKTGLPDKAFGAITTIIAAAWRRMRPPAWH